MATTATQIIPGAYRETNNPLLLKAEIGKPQTRGFILPTTDFTYGKISQGKCFGAADAFSWNTALKPLNLKKRQSRRDFITLNKLATQTGLVTAKEQNQYRATFNVSLEGNKCERRIKTDDIPPQKMVYGVPTKPSTPVFDLLEHKYQDKWLQEQNKLELVKQERERNILRSGNKKNYSETRASRLRRYSHPVDTTALWQMPRFQKNALPALETFRSEAARQKAFRHHQTDCISRKGVFGHGIYEGAKS